MSIALSLTHEQERPFSNATTAACEGVQDRVSMSDWITLATIFLFYLNAPAIGTRFHGIPMAAAGAIILMPAIPVVIYWLFHGQPLLLHRATWPAAAFVTVQLVSALRSDRPEVALAEVYTTLLEGICMVVVFANAIRSQQMLRYSIGAMVLAGSVLGGLSAWQQATGTYDSNYGGFAQMSDAAFQVDDQADLIDEESLDGEGYQRRLAGPIGEQNRYAQIMIVLVPLGLMQITRAKTHRLRLVAIVQVLLICTGTILTFSRGAAVAAGVLFLAMCALRWISWKQGLGILVGGTMLMAFIPAYRQRLEPIVEMALPGLVASESTGSQLDGSMKSRLTEMMAALRAYRDYPLLGVGPGLYRYRYRDYAGQVGLRVLTTMRRAHCLYLELAAETGTLGLMAFGSILFVTLNSLNRLRLQLHYLDPEQASLLASLILAWLAYLVTSVFLHMSFVRYFWLLVAISSAAIWVSQRTMRSLQDTLNLAGDRIPTPTGHVPS